MNTKLRPALASLALLVTAGLAAVVPSAGSSTAAPALPPTGPKPTVVLVHGAFADASGWTKVATQLQAEGYPVAAIANPLRGVQHDAAYVRSYLDTIEGPIVLVGHSYGGAVITNAATGDPDVKALVYVAAYALDEGETVQDANVLGGGKPRLGEHLVIRPFPGAAEGDADAYIDPAWFRRLFALDLPKPEAALLAASQRPAALAAFGTPSGAPAWKTIETWYVVAKHDRTIPPAAERFMAERAGARVIEVDSSHVPMISKPKRVLNVIRAAAR